MKILYLIGMLLLLSVILVSAKTIEMKPGDTWTGEYRKVSLVNLNKESAIICVNNQNFILKEDVRRNLNNVIVELKNIQGLTNTTQIYLKENCENCYRDESFFNKECFPQENNEDVEVNTPTGATIIETNSETNYFAVISLILTAAVLILILIWFLFTFR